MRVVGGGGDVLLPRIKICPQVCRHISHFLGWNISQGGGVSRYPGACDVYPRYSFLQRKKSSESSAKSCSCLT